MDGAIGQAPDQEAVHRAEGKSTSFGALSGARHMVEHPADLGGGKIGIEPQPGTFRHHLGVPRGFQSLTDIGGAAILPDDGVANGPTGGALPDQGGLALIGDAEAGDIRGLQPRLGQCPARSAERRRPEGFGIVLDPTGMREDLWKFLLRARDGLERRIEDNGAGGGGALVDDQNVRHGWGHSVCHDGGSLPSPRHRASIRSCWWWGLTRS